MGAWVTVHWWVVAWVAFFKKRLAGLGPNPLVLCEPLPLLLLL